MGRSKKGLKKPLIISSIILFLLIASTVLYFGFFRPTGLIGIDEETGMQAGWSVIDSGAVQDSFSCSGITVGEAQKCSVKIIKPCSTVYCDRMCIYSDQTNDLETIHLTGKNSCDYQQFPLLMDLSNPFCNCFSGTGLITCDGHSGYEKNALNYTCPGVKWSYVPAGGLTQSLTTQGYADFHAGDVTSEWVEIPHNTNVYAINSVIEYKKLALFTCSQSGLPNAGIPYCDGSQIYTWVDGSGDGCGGDIANGDKKQYGAYCPIGTTCTVGQGCVAAGCDASTVNKLSCVNINTQKKCIYSEGIYRWVETACVSPKVCQESNGCSCDIPDVDKCPSGMNEGEYMCVSDTSYRKCISKNGCKQLSRSTDSNGATLCDGGQKCLGSFKLVDPTLVPCGCEPMAHSVTGDICDKNNVGKEICYKLSTSNVIDRCDYHGDTATVSCPYWKAADTCSPTQSCLLLTSGSSTNYECGCPTGNCVAGTSWCTGAKTYQSCQKDGVALGGCIPKTNLPSGTCQNFEKCDSLLSNTYIPCNCANECSQNVLGCDVEINPISGKSESYPSICQSTPSTPICLYYEHFGDSCDSQNKLCRAGECVAPFVAEFSRKPISITDPVPNTDFFYKSGEDIYVSIRFSQVNVQVLGGAIKDANVLWAIVDCPNGQTECGGSQAIFSSNGYIGVDGTQAQYTFNDPTLDSGIYFVKANIQLGSVSYGHYYQQIAVGNMVSMRSVTKDKLQYFPNNKGYTALFTVSFEDPSGYPIPVTSFDMASYIVGGSSGDLGKAPSAENTQWTFKIPSTVQKAGTVQIKIKPRINNPVWEVDAYYDLSPPLVLAQNGLAVLITSPTTRQVKQGTTSTITFEVRDKYEDAITGTTPTVTVFGSVGSTQYTTKSIGDNKFEVSVPWTDAPAMYVKIEASKSGYLTGQSCPGDTGGQTQGCLFQVTVKQPDYTIYIIIGVIVVVAILGFIIYRGAKKK